MSRTLHRVVVQVATLAMACGSLAGCGHSVTPTPDYSERESIPRVQDLFAFSVGGAIELVWDNEPEIFAYVDGFIIYRAAGDTAPQPEAYVRLNDELSLEEGYIDSDVEENTRYWYQITSLSPAGVESLPEGPASARVDRTPPAPPTGLAANAGSTSVLLTWDPSPEPDLLHYNLFRIPPDPPRVIGPLGAPGFTDSFAIVPGDTLRYWVTAVDLSLNESDPGDTLVVIVPGP